MLGSEPFLSLNAVGASVVIAVIFTFALYLALTSAAGGEDLLCSWRPLGAPAGGSCGALNVDLTGIRGLWLDEEFPKSMLTYSAAVDNGAEKLRGRLAGLSWHRRGRFKGRRVP